MAKILIIDDEDHLRKLYSSTISERGYTVEVASNGIEGIDKMREFDPDLVVVDLIMPEMGGYEFLKTVKTDNTLKSCPILILSASNEIKEIAWCLDIGAVGFVPKSGTLSDIADSVETLYKTFVLCRIAGNQQVPSNELQ